MRSAAALLVCCLSVPALAAGQPAAPRPDGTFALRAPGGAETLDRLNLTPADRGRALVLLARALHGAGATPISSGVAITVGELFGPSAVPLPSPSDLAAGEEDDGADVVLAPFSEQTWRRILALEPRASVFGAIVASRGALLTASGALQADGTVRTWLADERDLLTQIVRRWPGAFALAGPALRLDAHGFVVPGGQAADAAWTALVGASPTRPALFLRRLLDRHDGQLARFFATLARLDDARRAAVVEPLGGEDATGALAAVYALAREAEAPWEPNLHPYQLSYADLPVLLHALDDLPLTALPRTAGWWPALLNTGIGSREDAAELLARPPATPALAATLRRMLDGPPRRRRDHVAVIALARRVLRDADPPESQADAVFALGQYARYRGLLLMLDRCDIDRPAVWARAVDAARRVDEGGGDERDRRLGLFQGALALVERARLAGSLSAADAGQVVAALAEPVAAGTPVERAVGTWITDVLAPALPPLVRPDRFSGRTAYESRILQALAGVPLDMPQPLSWEGLDYVVDVSAGELDRITRIRTLLPTPGLDAALESGDGGALDAALRALVYAPALGDPDGGVALGPDVVTRHDFGTRARAGGREFAWLPAQERSGAGAPWHVAGSLFGLDLALSRSALRRLSTDEMPAVPTVNLNDQLTLARTAVAILPRDMHDRVRDEIAAAIARGRARVQAAADTGAVLALGNATSFAVIDARTLPWTMAADPGAAKARFSLRDLLWLGEPDLTPGELAAWGVMGDAVDGRLATRLDAPIPRDVLAGRPDTGLLATQVPDWRCGSPSSPPRATCPRSSCRGSSCTRHRPTGTTSRRASPTTGPP
ncbi:MAG: hypothetical protein R2712_12585 [Vicinamibacterales bacterium]